MESTEEWDVEKYKTEHECDDHWELRKQFLLAHKNKFSEDELICLAQVFINVEFLGCRYPEETMQLIAELSHEVAADYRDKQKSKLKRTFVKASDAAGAKAKGLSTRLPKNTETTTSNASTSLKTDKSATKVHTITKKLETHKNIPGRTVPNNRKESICSGPFGNIVLVEHRNDNPINILTHAVRASSQNLEWKFKISSTDCECEIQINGSNLIIGNGATKKLAKKAAATNGLELLKNYYYTIKVKKTFHGEAQTLVSSESISESIPVENTLPDDNIGRKLMLMMGWRGGGLGKSQQGIVQPITVQQQISREGLGLKLGRYSQDILKKKMLEILANYLNSETKTDLVFESDFTNDERALIHQIARQLGAKSQSHGPKDNRTLVVSRKIDLSDLVNELKEMGGTTEKYELIAPLKPDGILKEHMPFYRNIFSCPTSNVEDNPDENDGEYDYAS